MTDKPKEHLWLIPFAVVAILVGPYVYGIYDWIYNTLRRIRGLSRMD